MQMKGHNMKASQLHFMLLLITASIVCAGQFPREVHCYRGKTPKVDGVICKGEYDDAVEFNDEKWLERFNPVADDSDLSLKWWVKHDGENFYFAFDVTDDVLYGIETTRWLPDGFLKAHELTPEGFPWFGDGLEIMMNPTNQWPLTEEAVCVGDGTSWQMVCNFTKSRLGGVGKGGLMEGEPRSSKRAWDTYQSWIKRGAMKAVVCKKKDDSGFVVEWMVKADPCIEVRPGEFWSPKMGVVKMGFNLAVQDLDEKATSKDAPFNIHHENWLAGGQDIEYWLREYGTLIVHPGPKPLMLFVSPHGSDENAGSEDKPFKTIQAAQEKVAQLKEKGLKHNIVVALRGGTYAIDKPPVFGPQHGGDANYSVTFTAYPGHEWPGEKVLISGGRAITGWTKGENDIWVTKLPQVQEGTWWFRQLFADDERLPRAKYPNDSYLILKHIEEKNTKFTFHEPLTVGDLNGQNAELVVLEHWSIARGIVTDTDANGLRTKDTLGWYGTPWWCQPGPNMPAYLEHALEFVDQPGEWYLDKTAGVLHYKAEPNENPNERYFVAPVAMQLLQIEGDEDKTVRNLHFKGLEFAYSGWHLPPFGYSGGQAAHYCRRYKIDPTYAVPLAVKLAFAEDCTLEMCRFAHIGSSGVGFAAQTHRNRIIGCEVYDVGANGIMSGWWRTEDRPPRRWFENDWKDPNYVPIENEFSNNYVHGCGRICFGAVGIWNAFTQKSTITHNVVSDMPYTGISVGFRWDDSPTSQKECRVAFNHVYDAMKELGDGGAIYTLGFQPDSELVGNLLHGVRRSAAAIGSHNNGIFFDEGSTGFLVDRNIIFDTSAEPIRFNSSKKESQTFKDNYFGVSPTDVRFPWALAAQAGIEPFYRMKVLEISGLNSKIEKRSGH